VLRRVAALAAVMLLASPSFAETVSHTVRKGDNLYYLSKRYGTTVEAIMTASGLGSIRLDIGQMLTIPARDSFVPRVSRGGVAKTTAKTTKARPKANSLEPGMTLDTYRVRRGDNLWQIARRNGMSVGELKEINGLTSSRLDIGQRLHIVVPDEQEPEPIWSGDEIPTEESLAKETGADSEIPEKVERLVLTAKRMLNTPYRWGGSSLKRGVDCSAYVQKVFGYMDFTLPRTAREQYLVGSSIDRGELTVGDLVFFKTYAKFPSHVGIYLGENLFIHASSRSGRVVIDSLETAYYAKRFIGGKRLIEGGLAGESADASSDPAAVYGPPAPEGAALERPADGTAVRKDPSEQG
jgi:cell wall-associated NlpC family hydrolase